MSAKKQQKLIPFYAIANSDADTLDAMCVQYRIIKEQIKPLEKDINILRDGMDDENGHTPGIKELAKGIFKGLARDVTGIASPSWRLLKVTRPGQLNKAKLLELGVPMSTIEAATGKPITVYQIVEPKDE